MKQLSFDQFVQLDRKQGDRQGFACLSLRDSAASVSRLRIAVSSLVSVCGFFMRERSARLWFLGQDRVGCPSSFTHHFSLYLKA
jgi:hypothetical protein